jgi:hypothetical protein
MNNTTARATRGARHIAATLGIAAAFCLAGAAHAEKHALIMAISAYPSPIPSLKGVPNDVESARRIARSMGVPDRNMRVYRDGELTLAGMRKAFDELEERADPNDQVFVYYSGHGTRLRVPEEQDRCAEGLVTADGQAFLDSEVEQRLKRLGQKATRLVVLLDACHSGGVTTRGGPALSSRAPADFQPKFYARAGAPTACERPVNVLTRGLRNAAGQPGSGAQNFVYIAAARDNEVSLDSPTTGGLATTSWLECVNGAARDLDGSGALSAEEIRVCAQERVNQKLAGVQGFLPHNISISGNGSAIMKFVDAAALQQPALLLNNPLPKPPVVAAPAPVAAPSPAPKPPVAAAPAPAPKPPVAASGFPPAYHTLTDIFSSRDDRRSVVLSPAKPVLKIGRDQVDFTLTSSHAGYVYLLMVGSDGKTFDVLFPNSLDRNNQIEANATLRLPRPTWQLTAGGPPGKNYLLAVVADAPRDFSGLGMSAAGPFSVLAATPVASKDIQLVTSDPPSVAANEECSDRIKKRNLVIAQRCSNAFGAAMTVIEEAN